ncbi:DUF3556 domain-containing protein [Pseudonocardia spinosispora]|uniref:DUF3556 domain-containing protein n=1 Tax=Pseudonocardia spinosispora TaxID=103441 RepID=UPI0004089247|nr:DUF3556 domain-containing protein [Pseudonocardia spinosispora]
MGFFSTPLPPCDLHFWHWRRRSERLEPLCKHWAEHGPGMPIAFLVLYALKIVGFVAGGLVFVRLSFDTAALASIGDWWTQPSVFQKVIVWALLFEILGLGSGFGPTSLPFLPPLGGPLYWLRPGTIRLPPWPGRVPFTRGSTRTLVDVLLYLAVLLAAGWLLCSSATETGALDPARVGPLAVLLPLLGLRDKTAFLAARPEHYGLTLLTFLLPPTDMMIAAQLLLVVMWWAAATSKLSRAFPFTVSTLLSNAPVVPRALSRRLFRSFPEDMRPSRWAGLVAWIARMIEFGAPLSLVSGNHTALLAGVVVLVGYHLTAMALMPFGAPLEWNLVIVFSVLHLFWGHPRLDLGSAEQPLLIALLTIPLVVLFGWGNVRPDQVSYLAAMRYYAGNWPVSMWALRPSAIEKIDTFVAKPTTMPHQQLRRLYGEQIAEVFSHKVYTFRAMHHHGRGAFGLLPRAVGPTHEDAIVIDGELMAGTMLGWNFGDAHLAGEQLVAALQERCGFTTGEVRVVVLESHPMGSARQDYRLVDAAEGVFERGFISVDDMVNRQPWEIEDLPTWVLSRSSSIKMDESSTCPVPPAENLLTKLDHE